MSLQTIANALDVGGAIASRLESSVLSRFFESFDVKTHECQALR
jgi:hypothetical protein